MGAKWTPEQTAKFKRTMKAKRASGWVPAKPKAKQKTKQMPRVWGNGYAETDISDAIGFLREAERDVIGRLRDGTLKRQDNAHILFQAALRILEKKL